MLTLFQDDTLVAPPGTRYSYSSPGYNVLGAAIQRVSGMPYQRYVEETILRPLGLASTGFDDVRRVLPHRARRYSFYDLTSFSEVAAPVRVPDWDYSHNMAGGNIVSTAEDLVKFGAALLAPGFLTDSAYRMLFTLPRTAHAESPMNFGFFVRPRGAGPPRLNIGGSNAGLQAVLAVYPDQALVVAAVTNTWGKGSRSGEFVDVEPNGLIGRMGAACPD